MLPLEQMQLSYSCYRMLQVVWMRKQILARHLYIHRCWGVHPLPVGCSETSPSRCCLCLGTHLLGDVAVIVIEPPEWHEQHFYCNQNIRVPNITKPWNTGNYAERNAASDRLLLVPDVATPLSFSANVPTPLIPDFAWFSRCRHPNKLCGGPAEGSTGQEESCRNTDQESYKDPTENLPTSDSTHDSLDPGAGTPSASHICCNTWCRWPRSHPTGPGTWQANGSMWGLTNS